MEVVRILQEVDTFLAGHESEAILRFPPFLFIYQRKSFVFHDSHYGRKCVQHHILSHVTLHWMKERGYQVFVIYCDNAAAGVSVYWPSNSWPTPWPQTTSVRTMIPFLEEKMAFRPMHTSFVTQCILTPDIKFILEHRFTSLEKKCGKHCNKTVILWLHKQKPGSKVLIL
jgi:hypothetical protein